MMASDAALVQWLRDAVKVTVIEEGEQAVMFENDWQKMYRLFDAKGNSKLVTATQAHRLGLKPTPTNTHYAAPTGCLFPDPQTNLFEEAK